jgi:hypothetical protein
MRLGAIITSMVILVLALMAWEDLAVPYVADLSCTIWMCDLYVALRDFQTLIGGGLALVAAWLAARPAWLQLKSINLQQEIAARQTIAHRLAGIEERIGRSTRNLTKFSQDITREIYDPYADDPYDPSSINAHWAFDKGHDARQLLESLVADQALRQDTADIEQHRGKVMASLEALQACLYNVSAKRYADDPERSEEEVRQLPVLEEQARQSLSDVFDVFDKSAETFGNVGRSEIQRFRRRLRSIDDTLLN